MNFWVEVLPPVLGALFIWWGFTGAIIYLCGRKEWRPYVFAAVTAIQPVAWWRLWAEKENASVGGVFAAFFWAIIIWSWIETSYYSGFVVGRKSDEIDPDLPVGQRFRRAISANLYHELSILFLSLVVIVLGWGGQNETGLWAFMILHWTHQSAKINIFLGVNNLTTEYLPDNLKYMAQYFTQRPSINQFFPFSISITTILATWLFSSILASRSAGEQVGQALLFVMMAAAVIEHWWLVTPVPSRVWEWALSSRRSAQPQNSATDTPPEKAAPLAPVATPAPLTLPKVYIVCGYLGSGKTTLIRHLLPQLDGRVAVIVNDFGAVGVDAELIKAQGSAGAVLELPGGCVCCTMQKNLSGQIFKLLEDYQPEQIIIEPSGVAGIEGIIQTLAHPRLRGKLGAVEVITVVEAPRLLAPGGLQKFTLTQLKAATSVVISKIDLILPTDLSAVLALVSNLNAAAQLFPAIEGKVSAAQLFRLAVPTPFDFLAAETDHAETAEDVHQHEHAEENSGGFISFARQYRGVFEPLFLKKLFADLQQGYFGPVERAKGLFITPGGIYQAWDLAGETVTCRLIPGIPAESASRFMLVAHDLATEELDRRMASSPTAIERLG